MFHRLTDAFTFFFEADHFKIYELVLKNSKLKVRWNLSCGTLKGHLSIQGTQHLVRKKCPHNLCIFLWVPKPRFNLQSNPNLTFLQGTPISVPTGVP